MKQYKYTFHCKVLGNISSDLQILEGEESIELNSNNMFVLYNRNPDLYNFFIRNRNDLSLYIKGDFESIYQIVFGNIKCVEEELVLVIEAYSSKILSHSEVSKLLEWIKGQLSDGWGEGIEQSEWKREKVNATYTYFDVYNLEFAEDYAEYDAYYYAHFDYDNICFEHFKVIEVEIKSEMVGFAKTESHSIFVDRFRNKESFIHNLNKLDVIPEGKQTLSSMLSGIDMSNVKALYMRHGNNADKSDFLTMFIGVEDDSGCRIVPRDYDQNISTSITYDEMLKIMLF